MKFEIRKDQEDVTSEFSYLLESLRKEETMERIKMQKRYMFLR